MSKHTIAEAESHFADLVARAERGEEVVITRDGRDVARMEAVRPSVSQKPISQEAVDWLDAHRVGEPAAEDAGTFVSRMRDEEWAR
jgi:antitoxin (DNA-binding transcriptional repressor) of toxin-antitoxin stability system